MGRQREIYLKLILEIYESMDNECRFAMDIKLSNICGCNKYY